MRSHLQGLGLAGLIAVGAVTGAAARDRFGYGGYADHDGYDGGYGFAAESVGGAYIGAPFTRIPRPSEIVPPAWGYGTYGVPTVTGIRQAPTAAPTITVINANDGGRRREGGTRISSNDVAPAGVRVLSVTVPRR